MYINIYEFISDKSELTFSKSGSVKLDGVSDKYIQLADPKYDLLLTKVENDEVYLNLKVDFDYQTDCDRCLASVDTSGHVDYQAKLVTEYPEEDHNKEYEEYVVYENGRLDLSELIRQLILLSIPSKVLCSPECKGICSQCGQDLNDGECKCKGPVGDLRFAVLEDLVLDDEEE